MLNGRAQRRANKLDRPLNGRGHRHRLGSVSQPVEQGWGTKDSELERRHQKPSPRTAVLSQRQALASKAQQMAAFDSSLTFGKVRFSAAGLVRYRLVKRASPLSIEFDQQPARIGLVHRRATNSK